MNTGYSKPEVEKPKLSKKEQRTMLHLEARSFANTLDELARAHQSINPGAPIVGTLEKAAKFLRVLAD